MGLTKALVSPSIKISSASPFFEYMLFSLINLFAIIGIRIEFISDARMDLIAKEV